MIDYTIYYRRQLDLETLRDVSRKWALFISAYNDSERVRRPFEIVEAPRKHWLVHGEYQFPPGDLPTQDTYAPDSAHEAEFWQAYLDESGTDLCDGPICVNATGFMRPHLAFLLVLLQRAGATRVHVIYTDPERYVKSENTQFTKGPVSEVRQIAGFEGSHVTDTTSDLLVIGAGYDHQLIRRVAENKENARKLQMFRTSVAATEHVSGERHKR